MCYFKDLVEDMRLKFKKDRMVRKSDRLIFVKPNGAVRYRVKKAGELIRFERPGYYFATLERIQQNNERKYTGWISCRHAAHQGYVVGGGFFDTDTLYLNQHIMQMLNDTLVPSVERGDMDF